MQPEVEPQDTPTSQSPDPKKYLQHFAIVKGDLPPGSRNFSPGLGALSMRTEKYTRVKTFL